MKKEYKKQKIYCPNCGRKVMTYDGRHHMVMEIRCKHCGKKVVFNPETKSTEAKEMEKRTTSSGLRFGFAR